MTDVFRKEYKPLKDGQKELIEEIKTCAEKLYKLYTSATARDEYCFDCPREIAIAKTHLEDSVMWAVKGISS